MRLIKAILADLRKHPILTIYLLCPLWLVKRSRWNVAIMIPKLDEYGWGMKSLNKMR